MIECRCIEEQELNQVEELEKDVFSDAWTKKGIADTFANPQAWIMGAFEEGTLYGYLIFYYVIDEGEIARIAVRESARRQGIAGRLFDFLLSISEEHGIIRWMLDVRESNLAAIACYEKEGFLVDGKRKGFYQDPQEDAILMSKMLTR